MHKATRVIVSLVAMYAAFLGILHGYFELNHSAGTPEGIFIEAIGASCDPATAFHACWPAMTLVPDYQISGILAFSVASLVLVWTMAFIEHKRGCLILCILAGLLLIFGGGFLPPFYIMLAAAASTRINGSLVWWKTHLSSKAQEFLAAIWPWPIVIYLLWAATELIFGEVMNGFLSQLMWIFIPVEVALLVLSIISAFAQDIHTATWRISVSSTSD